jgi:hypothetical protein
MLMNQLYTAYYSDGRIAHEKPLDWIYQNQGNARVEIRLTIWLWKVPEVELYLVDYVGQCAGFTLQTFGSLKAAEEFKAKIGQMEESEFKNWLLNRQQ